MNTPAGNLAALMVKDECIFLILGLELTQMGEEERDGFGLEAIEGRRSAEQQQLLAIFFFFLLPFALFVISWISSSTSSESKKDHISYLPQRI